MATDYVMEHAAEGLRMERKTDEQQTAEHLRLVGLGTGLRVLDAGAATGAVTRTIAKLVGPTGSAVAFDGSKERLDQGAALATEIPNLSFVHGDLYQLPFKEEEFDFVWCRFVFSYLKDPTAALANLVRATRKGGKVVVADIDGNGLFHYPVTAEFEKSLETLKAAFKGRFDPFVGRKLYHYFCGQPLKDVRVHVLPYHVYAGTAPESAVENWIAKLETIRPAGVVAFESETAYARFVNQFVANLRDPKTFTYSTLHIVEGVRVE